MMTSALTQNNTYTVYKIQTISYIQTQTRILPFEIKTYETFRRYSEFEKLL